MSVATLLGAVIDVLKAKHQKGQGLVWLSAEAKLVLNKLHLAQRHGRRPAPAGASSVAGPGGSQLPHAVPGAASPAKRLGAVSMPIIPESAMMDPAAGFAALRAALSPGSKSGPALGKASAPVRAPMAPVPAVVPVSATAPVVPAGPVVTVAPGSTAAADDAAASAPPLPAVAPLREALSPIAEITPIAPWSITTLPVVPLPERPKRLMAVAAEAARSSEVRALGSFRETMVFSTGYPGARLMLIGDAPGMEEERQCEPFVGPAGQLLSKIVKVMGLDRQQAYFTNVCKYRPKIDGADQGANCRPPTRREMETCMPFLRQELEIVRPEVILALGTSAAHGLLQCADPVTQLRGQWFDFLGIPVRVTYHPSYLLLVENTSKAMEEKRKCWEDMMACMTQLGMPISEKQRKFFLV